LGPALPRAVNTCDGEVVIAELEAAVLVVVSVREEDEVVVVELALVTAWDEEEVVTLELVAVRLGVLNSGEDDVVMSKVSTALLRLPTISDGIAMPRVGCGIETIAITFSAKAISQNLQNRRALLGRFDPEVGSMIPAVIITPLCPFRRRRLHG
jgi:hypothetical protein